MKFKYRLLVFFLVIFIVLLGCFFAYWASCLAYDCSPFNNNIVDAISFIVAIIALVFSAVTYFSIDSVNSVTSMNGNVLENPNYTITASTAIQNFSEYETYEEYERKLFDIVKVSRFSKSCMVFADEIQCIIDNLVWFTDINMKNEENVKRINKLVKQLKQGEKHYNKLSNGINYLLGENIKLIEYILQFQVHRKSDELHICALENVRGEMLINPVSRIIYYDYVGLDYSKQVRRMLDIEGENKDFSLNNLQMIQKCIASNQYDIEILKRIEILLKRANMFFEKALSVAQDNILWEGYILCNVARTKVQLFLLQIENITKEDVVEAYNQVIEMKRTEMVLCFNNDRDSFLKSKYEYRLDQMITERNVFIYICEHPVNLESE